MKIIFDSVGDMEYMLESCCPGHFNRNVPEKDCICTTNDYKNICKKCFESVGIELVVKESED